MAGSSSALEFEPDEILAFTREFDAPLALVWRMWRDPEHMVRWHGPEGMWLTHCEMDFRVGGKWRRCMANEEGVRHWIRGEYLDIREPDRLQFTYINESDGHEMVVTMDFAERDGRTLMDFHQAPFISVAERDGHGFGWRSGFGLMADYLVKVRAAGEMVVGRPRIDGVAEDIVAARADMRRQAVLTLPKIVDRAEQHYVAVRDKVTIPFGPVIDRLMGEAADWLEQNGVSEFGPAIFKYNLIDMPRLDMEFGFIVPTAPLAHGRVTAGILPAGRYGTVTYTGPYDDLESVTAVLIGWARQTGIEWDAAPGEGGESFVSRFELYLNGPMDEPDPQKLQTEIWIKVKD